MKAYLKLFRILGELYKASIRLAGNLTLLIVSVGICAQPKNFGHSRSLKAIGLPYRSYLFRKRQVMLITILIVYLNQIHIVKLR